MIKFIKYFSQSIFIYFFFIIGKIIGLNLSRKLFSFLFNKLGKIFKSKKIINSNLEIFEKNISLQKKEKIITNMWVNYGMTFIEYIFLSYFKKNYSHITIEGENYLDNILKKGKPVIFVSGHFANYELMSMEITKKDIKLATIYRPLNNYFLNPLMEYLRKKYVCPNQIKKGMNGVREAIHYIKKNYSVALMIDQRVSEGEKIDLFGKAAFTTTLPAQLALKYDLSICPVYIERVNVKNFSLKFFDEIKSSNFKNKIELSKKLNSVLEEMIKKNPDQWIWTHNRWK
tara:strand:- start:3 stop:860 length:858 start_codon:yes stop_codon:yes gene_type:complete